MIYEAELGNLNLIATGDAVINRPLSVYREEAFTQLIQLIRGADARFLNFETLVHDFEFPAAEKPTPTYLQTDPQILGELKWAGFNLISAANNHAFDYGEGGLLTNLSHLRESALAFSGVGRNLTEAREPAYLVTPRGIVALICLTSSYPDQARAMDQRPDLQGRPGINPLRYDTTYTVDEEAFQQIQRMSSELGLDTARRRVAAAGHQGNITHDADSEYQFLGRRFVRGDKMRAATAPHRRDLEGNLRWIREARRQADWVLVSVHSHEFGETTEDPPQFLCTFAKAAVDAGADVVISHGADFVKGVEIYHGKPILYGVGRFAFQVDQVRRAPAESYERFGLDYNATPGELYDARSGNETRGIVTHPAAWEGAMFECQFTGGQLHALRFHPIDLGFKQHRARRGRPVLAGREVGQSVLERIQRLSKPYGTTVTTKDGVGAVEF